MTCSGPASGAAAVGLTVTWAAANPGDLPFGAGEFDRVLSAVGGPLAMAPDQPGWRARWRGCAWRGAGGGELDGRGPGRPGRPGDRRLPAATAAGRAVPVGVGCAGFCQSAAWPVRLCSEAGPADGVVQLPLADSYLSYLEEVHGPTIMALRLASEQGRRAELRAGLLDLYSGANTASDGTLAFDLEHLPATAAARTGH